MLGFDDFLHPGAVVVIEWADKVRDVLKNICALRLKWHIRPPPSV